MKIKMLNEKELMKRLPAELAGGIEGADYVVPRGTQRELVALGWSLKANAPVVLSSLESVSLIGVTKGCEYVALVMTNNDRILPVSKARELRMSTVKASAAIKGILKLAAGSDVTEVSTAAQQVLAELYRGDLDRLHSLSPRGVWNTVLMLEHKLANAPELRAQLEEMVPKSMVGRIFSANEQLGHALGVTQHQGEVLSLDLAAAKALLRRRLSRYASAIMASADEDSPATVRRVRLALRPILALRDEVGRRHGRKPGEDEDDDAEVEEEETPVPGPARVVAAPVAPAAADDDDVVEPDADPA